MNLEDNTKKMTETALITTLMVILVFIGVYALPIVLIFYPVPFIVLAVRRDIKYSIFSIIASSLIVCMLMDIFTGLFIFLLFGAVAIALAFMMKKGYEPYKTVVISSAVGVFIIVLAINITAYITGVSFISQIESLFNEVINMQTEIIRDINLTQSQITEMTNILKTTFDRFILIIPSVIIICSVLNSYINYWLSSSVLKRLGHKVEQVPSFMYFRLPENIVLGTIVIFGGTLIINYLKVFYYDTLMLNVITILSFVFFIQGLAVITYLLNKIKLNKIVRAISLFFIIVYAPISLMISVVGFFDSLINFRKLKNEA